MEKNTLRQNIRLKEIINPANQVMKDRTTIRTYDADHKIERDTMRDILQDACTAPSSLNLQPWRFVVVDTPEGKDLIKPYMMFNLLQWETCSAVIAVYGDLDNFDLIDDIYDAAVDRKFMEKADKEHKIGAMKEYRKTISDEKNLSTVMQDCGYVGMQLMLSAKAYGYDTNPIGGYDREGVSKALGIDTKRYVPALLYTIGKAKEEVHPSLRFSVDDITQWK